MIHSINRRLLKFGKWYELEDVYFQRALTIFSKDCYLNIINKRLEEKVREKFDNIHQKYLNCIFSKELKDIYKECNGFNLFSQSLVLFGVAIDSKTGFVSIDLVRNNNNLKNYGFNTSYSDYYAIGYYAKNYFCLKKDSSSGVVVINRDDLKVVHRFTTIKETYEYYICKLAEKYSEDGLKILVNPSDERIQIENRCTEEL